jgi:hypothetical protein
LTTAFFNYIILFIEIRAVYLLITKIVFSYKVVETFF